MSIAKLHFDILAPTLNTYGKGLHYYECILMDSQNMIGSSSGKTKDETVINKSVYTDLEMDLFRQNLLFINKQSKIQIQEWIKKDKWDLNLGEAIKGFYQAPVF